MTYDVVVNVSLKEAVLDPAGQQVARVLHNMGYAMEDVRIGKQIKLRFQAADLTEAKENARQMAEKLLANPVLETYEILVTEP
ncbi:MAG: phosphoribosylformylglycinamidine synthase subunit PurS [Firmicutes bacterium]|jgi:phosphoribosylformylglycinamidine synthase|uniref:Phosphoribosylformylglycinamidine synthase subunit PurS n=1 Tax=Sulfobacillus benefaciens TaxID=453960 RepID=A0A2T2X1D9_9FIRM|nr:phosphoribosylformylglycinamidine synthase subunit PurS [Bacillota bacterium]MCL5015281.1 phosphoribosylformylglycinamidine synthase subunit PurS [Bacillota bacterium]PSR28301.1 MAG: phosphoribosylformylglycinamidine synthase [Sulfobacillus benefaciens]HBQ96094.1 phosphoribosylformylglycinamidine synthase [Sulfobacillus sp.]